MGTQFHFRTAKLGQAGRQSVPRVQPRKAPNGVSRKCAWPSGGEFLRLAGQANVQRMTDPSHKAPSIDLLGNPVFFDDVVVGIFRSTEEGRYVYANHRLAELYGYDSPAKLIEAIGDIEGQLYVEPEQRDSFLKLIQQRGVSSSLSRRFSGGTAPGSGSRKLPEQRGTLPAGCCITKVRYRI